jgi:hypothetical protein
MERIAKRKRGRILVCVGFTILGVGAFYIHLALGGVYTAFLCLTFGFYWSDS